jgi:hypothetical protein
VRSVVDIGKEMADKLLQGQDRVIYDRAELIAILAAAALSGFEECTREMVICLSESRPS